MSIEQPELEPSADMRMIAHQLREMYVALIRESFTVQESLAIIGHAISAGGKR